jgi:hypothetical protein
LTFTVPERLYARVEAAEIAYAATLHRIAQEHTAEAAHATATTGRKLAAIYREVRAEFCRSQALFHALCRAEAYLISEAEEDERFADLLDEVDLGGDAA